ncbi:small ribosomal subunit protein uS11m [Pantherophis guttatus]|uniref:Small ribosomal subunit protein uS11m n=1 Tax=Pantherophis guttatus TaxID=94885 RepID=A0A6P9CN60_PANGU|nr:small ribosomal subunit protein uS11m [Pantherophis guttatus]
MLAALAIARRGLLGGGSGCSSITFSRTIQSGIQRFQALLENPDLATDKELDSTQSKSFSYFPPVLGEESSLRWDGKKFEEIPIVHIKATYNNTHIQVFTAEKVPLVLLTCGYMGFKNAKKSTALAAQTTGIAAGNKAAKKGVHHVRVVVKGLGPGRLAAIQGLTLGGLEVISITDNTPVPHNGCRPRKARRL